MKEHDRTDRIEGRGAEREGKYLTFSLGVKSTESAFFKIKEIIGMMRITPIPQTTGVRQGSDQPAGKVIP